ncbi:hypothetical protein [Dokdonella sp.]|uniref:WD40/YVTN/BNR-like repeat-containing protein n=1 Tax=Dokdonella sp. TaxID=2291710 RepID=UPI001B094303|nr:hypothetical protein [Dokdonella sp.]MBO9664388.1 hypothetical protein [Dokdonella sp.]
MHARRFVVTVACWISGCLTASSVNAAPAFDADGARPPRPDRSIAAVAAPRGDLAWQSLGPPGGDVADVVASPTEPGALLAGTAPLGSFGGNLYRSADGGASWSVVADLSNRSVFALVFDGAGKAHAATQDGVWSSEDGGRSWTQRDLGIDPTNDAVLEIAVDPGDPSNLWIGLSAAFGNQSVNLMHSTDGGASWQDATPPLAAPSNGTSVAVDPANPLHVAAAFSGDFSGGEVWLSEDGGASWQNRSAGLPGTPVNALAWNGARLLAGGGMLFGSQDFGLYGSDDLGQSWTPLHAGWPLLIATAIAVDPNDAQTIVVATDGGGLNRSRDGGATWELGIGGSGALATQSVRYAPGDSQELLAGANSLGVFLSHDGGATLGAASNGISELGLYSVAADPLDPQQLAVAFQGNNSGGVLSSTDGGASWMLEAAPPTRYSKLGYSPAGVLYAISSGPSYVAPEGLYRRESDGSWTSLGPDQGPHYESDLASLRFSRNDPDLILLAGGDFGVAGNDGTVWRSTDAGASWTKHAFAGGLFVGDVEIVEDGSDAVVIAPYNGRDTPEQGGVLRSTDGGATWSTTQEMATFHRSPRLCGQSGRPAALFLAVATDWSVSGLLRSDDAGATWTPTAWQGATAVDVACDPLDPDVLYLAQEGATRVMRSTDQGAAFAPFDGGLGLAGIARELAFAGGRTPRLLLASGRGSYAIALEDRDAIFADGFD